MLRLFFRAKNPDKIILISDSLPVAHSDLGEIDFCGQKVLKSGRNSKGTLAGSVLFVEDIIKRLVEKKILGQNEAQKMAWDNPIAHLGLSEAEIKKMENII